MYNELIKKISEADTPFQPMGAEEQAEVNRNNPINDYTVTFTFTSDVEAKNPKEAEHLAIEDLEDSFRSYAHRPDQMFRIRVMRGMVREAQTPFQPMSPEEQKRVKMSPREIIKWLKVIPPYIEESEMQYDDDDAETKAHWQKIIDAVYEAIDHIAGEAVPEVHSRV